MIFSHLISELRSTCKRIVFFDFYFNADHPYSYYIIFYLKKQKNKKDKTQPYTICSLKQSCLHNHKIITTMIEKKNKKT